MIHLVEHFIQRDILRTLSRRQGLSFSELKPQGIDNGIFSYHLKSLLSAGLVVRNDEQYSLSVEGTQYVSWVTRTNLDVHPQPKLFCFLIIENERGEFLLHKRNAQPFLGRYTFPGGALFFGEDLGELVTRQLLEKVGFRIKMQDRGMASLRLGEGGYVMSHTYAHLFYGTVLYGPRPHAKDKRFTPEWVSLDDLAEANLLPDVRVIVDKLKTTKEYFFLDLYLAGDSR